MLNFVMKKAVLIILTSLLAMYSYGQVKKIILSGYVSSGISKSPTQHTIYKNGKVTSSNLTKSSGIFFGAGIILLRKLGENWNLGGDLAFISKGYFATRDTAYNVGSLGSTSYRSTDLNYLETTLFIEKQILFDNPDYKLLFSSGLFYGLHVTPISGSGLEANGNDFGTSISFGIQRKRMYAKLDFKKGLLDIKNNTNASFKTNILSLKIGLVAF